MSLTLCLASYADTDHHCTLPLGHNGDHANDAGTWAQVHHPSCPARHLVDAGGPYLAAACLCGPEAAAEDAVIMAERTPDTMLLDVLAHAALALDGPTTMLPGPVGRRVARQLGILL